MKKSTEINRSTDAPGVQAELPSAAILTALGALSLSLLPLWRRHLSTSRAYSKAAVSEMLQAFSTFGPYLQKTVDQSGKIAQAMDTSADSIGLSGLAEACTDELLTLSASLDTQWLASIQRISLLIQQARDKLLAATEPLGQGAEDMRQKLDQLFVGFQYQDRVDQMMALIEDDMARLNELLTNRDTVATDLQVDQWLARLASQYAMAEQRQDKDASEPEPKADSEPSFF